MNNRFMARFGVAALLMSAAGTSVDGAGAGPVAELDAEVNEIAEKFSKKGKVVSLVSDNQDKFLDFTALLVDGESNPTFVNYADKADATLFTGLAMVQPETGAARLIPIASEEAVFNDPVARKALYKMYVNRVVNAASDDEANPANFLTVAGSFKQKFDLDAYKFQAKVLTKILREQGLSGVTNKSLQLAFASSAFAETQFPRVKSEDWDKVIALAEGMAAKHGYDTSIFDHWKATRAVASGDTSELVLDFGKLMAAEEALPVNEAG